MKNSSWAYGWATGLSILGTVLTALEAFVLREPSFHKWFFFGFAAVLYCTGLIIETIENNQKPPHNG